MQKIFTTFTDASTYAKNIAQESRTTIKLEREGSNWVVIKRDEISDLPSKPSPNIQPDYRPPHVPETDWHERHLEEQRKKEKQEKKLREIEQKEWVARQQERVQRRTYLEERETHYHSLSKAKLEKLWSEREEMELELDEISLLRKIVREVKGIEPIYGNDVQACRQCGMVGDNCTCGRSWF